LTLYALLGDVSLPCFPSQLLRLPDTLHRFPWLKPFFPLAAFLAWALAAASSASEAYEGPYVLLPWVSGVLVAVFYAASLAFALVYDRTPKPVEPEILLRNMLVGGLFTLSLVLLSQLFPPGNRGPLAYFTGEVYPLLACVPLIIYQVRSFARIRHLIDERSATTRQWQRSMTVLLFAAAFAAVLPLPGLLLFTLFALAAVPAFSLLFRVRWIGELSQNSRVYVFVYLFLITWVHLGLVLWFFVEDAHGIFFSQAHQNPFPLLLLMFNGAYALMSLLSVLFNWPMTAIMERRNNDIFGFQSLHEQISHQGSAEDIQELLLDLCYRNSGARAAWFTRPLNGAQQVQYLKRGEVALGQISRWEGGLRQLAAAEVAEREGHLYVRNAVRHPQLEDLGAQFKTALSFPMSVNGQPEGSLVLLKEPEDAFDEYSIRMLGTYVNQARLALEKNRLVAQAVENERMKNEFEIATRVQENLLPRAAPVRSWVSLAVAYRPAQEVGGDCYDFFEREDNLAMVVGDVTGKGMGAAFNVAELKGIFHSNLDHLDDPEEFLYRVNKAVSACFDPQIFLTLVFLSFRPLDNQFIYARAGHCPILFYRAADGNAAYLEDKGMGLGIVRTERYRSHIQVNSHRFDTNDIIVLFTDGIMEANHPETGEEFGLERLRHIVARHAFFTAEEIKRRILDDIQEFLGGGRAGDDITLLVIKFQ